MDNKRKSWKGDDPSSRSRSTTRPRRSPSSSRSSSRSRHSRSPSRRSRKGDHRQDNGEGSSTGMTLLKSSAPLLIGIGVAAIAAHKFWPKGMIYGGKEDWENKAIEVKDKVKDKVKEEILGEEPQRSRSRPRSRDDRRRDDRRDGRYIRGRSADYYEPTMRADRRRRESPYYQGDRHDRSWDRRDGRYDDYRPYRPRGYRYD